MDTWNKGIVSVYRIYIFTYTSVNFIPSNALLLCIFELDLSNILRGMVTGKSCFVHFLLSNNFAVYVSFLNILLPCTPEVEAE